jgi:electron transfer flavoprotein beta subunit
MKIIVCIKQVPNTTEIKIDPVTGTLNREGAVSIMNPDDKVGLEFALRLKDAHQAHITVVSMGPPQAKKVLYEALAMGADRAMLLTDRLFAGSDSLATSLTLAGLLKTLEYDLIITGRQAIDGDTAQVGPQIAEHLGIPQISYVNSLKFEDGYFIAVRQFEDRYQTLKATAPLLVTILGDAAKPRSLHVGRLIEATETESVELKGASDIIVDTTKLGLKGSPTKVKSTWNKVVDKQKNLLEVEPREAVKAIIDTMKKRHII